MNCPSCGDIVKDENALFCPYCANRLTMAKKRSSLQITSAVLTIVGACLTITSGFFGLVPYIATLGSSNYYYGLGSYFLAMGVFNTLSFPFGIMSGIFTLRRKHFWWSIIGTSLVLASGFLSIMSFSSVGSVILVIGFMFGLPVIVLALLGLIFGAVSRNEFV